MMGLSSRCLDNKPEYAERLTPELRIIIQKGFENYILIIADIIDEARRKVRSMGPEGKLHGELGLLHFGNHAIGSNTACLAVREVHQP